ncbi:MAG: hypothetical protein K1W14_06455 [Muribaculaceae bacterium]
MKQNKLCGNCRLWQKWEHGEYHKHVYGICCLPGVFTPSDFPCDRPSEFVGND